MRLGKSNIWVKKTHKGEYWYGSDVWQVKWQLAKDDVVNDIAKLYSDVLRGVYDNKDTEINQEFCRILQIDASKLKVAVDENGNKIKTKADKKFLAQSLMNFFSEFHFEPNFRFMNTLALMTKKQDISNYISNYFKLIDSPFTSSVIEKMKSKEFDQIALNLIDMNPQNKINQRFSLYYGSQGTGKTTIALQSASKCMVCHSAMLPQDLMEDFKFEDGKAAFRPSALYLAMLNGETIVLDEINLLPFESLRFLQSILDGKLEITYKGQTIKIADGFKVIGTMNLVVNGAVFSLPEPLIDRASELREFKLTADDLIVAFD